MKEPREEKLRILQFNAENLFLFLDQHDGSPIENIVESDWSGKSTSPTSNKPLKKLWSITEFIRELDPHFILFNEVGGLESLENFNHYFLKDGYRCHLIEGNSDRGIDIGFMVRREVPLKCLLLTHKNRSLLFKSPKEQERLPRKAHYFARDLAELRIFREGENSPALVLMLAHLKSKLDPDGIDPGGRLRREAEVRTLIQIYKEVQSELEHKVPILLAGDFNGIARKVNGENEFASLFVDSDLTDVFDFCEVKMESRFTQIQFPDGSGAKPLQLDYIFISKLLEPYVIKEETFVYRFKGDLGFEIPVPASLDQRYGLPSDHYPVMTTIKNFLY